VSGGLRFAIVEAGTRHTCGVTVENTAYCWGQEFQGELGDGPPAIPNPTSADLIRATPSRVAGGLAFTAVSAGALGHSCGLTADHRTFCWGANDFGQLGAGRQDAYPGLPYSMHEVPIRVADAGG
jgi:alpha-tubulin suppressor-like RCC1 family protein